MVFAYAFRRVLQLVFPTEYILLQPFRMGLGFSKQADERGVGNNISEASRGAEKVTPTVLVVEQ